MSAHDPVNHPQHYCSHPSGIECIQIAEQFNFNLGNAWKYLWRAGEKGDFRQDLEKARWYISREIDRQLIQRPFVVSLQGGWTLEEILEPFDEIRRAIMSDIVWSAIEDDGLMGSRQILVNADKRLAQYIDSLTPGSQSPSN